MLSRSGCFRLLNCAFAAPVLLGAVFSYIANIVDRTDLLYLYIGPTAFAPPPSLSAYLSSSFSCLALTLTPFAPPRSRRLRRLEPTTIATLPRLSPSALHSHAYDAPTLTFTCLKHSEPRYKAVCQVWPQSADCKEHITRTHILYLFFGKENLTEAINTRRQ